MWLLLRIILLFHPSFRSHHDSTTYPDPRVLYRLMHHPSISIYHTQFTLYYHSLSFLPPWLSPSPDTPSPIEWQDRLQSWSCAPPFQRRRRRRGQGRPGRPIGASPELLTCHTHPHTHTWRTHTRIESTKPRFANGNYRTNYLKGFSSCDTHPGENLTWSFLGHILVDCFWIGKSIYTWLAWLFMYRDILEFLWYLYSQVNKNKVGSTVLEVSNFRSYILYWLEVSSSSFHLETHISNAPPQSSTDLSQTSSSIQTLLTGHVRPVPRCTLWGKSERDSVQSRMM